MICLAVATASHSTVLRTWCLHLQWMCPHLWSERITRKLMNLERKAPRLHLSSNLCSSPRKWSSVGDIFQSFFAPKIVRLENISPLQHVSEIPGLRWGVERHCGANRRDFILGSVQSIEHRSLFIRAAEWHNQSSEAENHPETTAYLCQVTYNFWASFPALGITRATFLEYSEGLLWQGSQITAFLLTRRAHWWCLQDPSSCWQPQNKVGRSASILLFKEMGTY